MDDQNAGVPLLSRSSSAFPSARQRGNGPEAHAYIPRQDQASVGRFRSHSMERPSNAPRRHGHPAASKSRLPTTAPLITKLKTGRQTNKAVPLPLEGHAQTSLEGSLDLVEDIRRSILALAIADGFNLKDTMPVLRAAFPRADLHLISECLHFSIHSEDGEHTEEAYLFDYGTLIFWGCGEDHRSKVLLALRNPDCQITPLAPAEVERDTFSVIYAPVEKSVIANDTITIPQVFSTDWRIKVLSPATWQIHGGHATSLCCFQYMHEFGGVPGHLAAAFPTQMQLQCKSCLTACKWHAVCPFDLSVQMAISHALAQSTKLLLYEQRLGDLVNRTKDMPAYLAKTGQVAQTRKQIAQLIGTVFIHKSNVNLLSSVLDTPEYFWAAPDIHQRIYKRVTEYLELDQRITVLNNRFEVITELLNIIREHDNHLHMTRLEWIVIWLIVVEVVVGLLECASILGFVKSQHLTL